MREVTIVRDPSTASGTFGVLTTDSGFSVYTLEPSRTRKEHPCIPEGYYTVTMCDHPKHGRCYELGVNGRTAILIHAGNFAADPPGKSDSEGCILLGNAIGIIGNQDALLSSRDAYNRFMSEMEGAPFALTIKKKENARPS